MSASSQLMQCVNDQPLLDEQKLQFLGQHPLTDYFTVVVSYMYEHIWLWVLKQFLLKLGEFSGQE